MRNQLAETTCNQCVLFISALKHLPPPPRMPDLAQQQKPRVTSGRLGCTGKEMGKVSEVWGCWGLGECFDFTANAEKKKQEHCPTCSFILPLAFGLCDGSVWNVTGNTISCLKMKQGRMSVGIPQRAQSVKQTSEILKTSIQPSLFCQGNVLLL
ncbi:hypothetical protein AMECASPLE_013584 [Ameca splendens]|uniref:Uncharacterized protein n=1 Tax=Ameca splendens TaxID=208324 RepID=A0ABV0YCJ8_9TELE